jgi:hypothetical protein
MHFPGCSFFLARLATSQSDQLAAAMVCIYLKGCVGAILSLERAVRSDYET